MSISPDQYRLIIDYVHGHLEGEELVQFKAQLQSDSELAKAVELEQNINAILQDKESIELIETIKKNRNNRSLSPWDKIVSFIKKNKWILLIGALLVLFFLMTMWQPKPLPIEDEFVPIALNDKSASLNEKSLNLLATIQDSFNLNTESGYQAAIAAAHLYLVSDPNNFEIFLYKGIAQRRIGNIEEGLETFSFIINGSPNIYKSKARWESVEIYLETNQKEKALDLLRIIIQDKNADKYEEASALMKVLED